MMIEEIKPGYVPLLCSAFTITGSTHKDGSAFFGIYDAVLYNFLNKI